MNFCATGPSNRGMAGRLYFRDYELTPATGELRRNGRIVPLQRQPALALVVLASRRRELVTRRELRSAIWPQDTHVDFERGLNFCIRQVRAAPDDNARTPRRPHTRAGVSAGLAIAGISLLAVTPIRPSKPHPPEHHRAGVPFVWNVHDAVFGSGASGPHHEAARRVAVMLHDLFY